MPDFRIPRPYKTLIALAVVVGPVYWLMFTADGQRRTDVALLSLLGRPAFDAALDRFGPGLDEASMRQRFPAPDWRCAQAANPFGDRLCTAALGSFNHYPAQAVTLYFRGQALSAVKVLYQRAYHDEIRAWVERRAGLRRSDERPVGPRVDQGVASWQVTDGLLVMKDGALGPADEPALFWLAEGAGTRP